MKKFEYLVFIGRFQPFHQGHRYVLSQALSAAEQVIVLIGSANLARSIKNPFSVHERHQMILGSFDASEQKRIFCLGVDDTPYNDNQWLMNVQSAITSITGNTSNDKIAIIGHNKDESSYYLGLFPQYLSYQVQNFAGLSATPIRHAYFDDKSAYNQVIDKLPNASQAFLAKFASSDAFGVLQREYQHIKAYQAAWQHSPYPPSFITADAIVVQSGHILLIKRGGDYGHGLYALPGGFVDSHEDCLTACLREIAEETHLDLDTDLLKSRLVSSQLFDAPNRSLRARTITMAYYFELPHTQQLPSVQAGDDAAFAFWLPLSQLDASQMFEDHYGIICQVLGI